MIGEEAGTGGNVMLGPSTSRPLEPLDGAAALVPTHSLNHSYLRLLRDLPRQWWKDPTNANADDLLAKDPNANAEAARWTRR